MLFNGSTVHHYETKAIRFGFKVLPLSFDSNDFVRSVFCRMNKKCRKVEEKTFGFYIPMIINLVKGQRMLRT